MSLNDDLVRTLSMVHSLEAKRQDYLQDYYHDAIIHELEKGKRLEDWLPYIYKCVSRRIGRGREGPMDLPLEESIIPNSIQPNIDLQLDISNALAVCSMRQQLYIYRYFYLEYTQEEIASYYDTTKQAVEQCISRGLRLMKKELS